MSFDIRLPNITAQDTQGQLSQVKTYLYQLAEQLNWALRTVTSGDSIQVQSPNREGNNAGAESNSLNTFNSIKSLIIKSADIVNAYYEEINRRLNGLYVAKSDFGTYQKETSQDISENSESIQRVFTNIQQILTDVEGIENTLVDVNAHIKSGLLYYNSAGIPIYGLEIGQRSEIDGLEVFNKYARFTSEKLSFYDSNDIEVAYVSDKKLYITHIEVTGSFQMSGFVDTVLADGSVVTKWVDTGG